MCVLRVVTCGLCFVLWCVFCVLRFVCSVFNGFSVLYVLVCLSDVLFVFGLVVLFCALFWGVVLLWCLVVCALSFVRVACCLSRVVVVWRVCEVVR